MSSLDHKLGLSLKIISGTLVINPFIIIYTYYKYINCEVIQVACTTLWMKMTERNGIDLLKKLLCLVLSKDKSSFSFNSAFMRRFPLRSSRSLWIMILDFWPWFFVFLVSCSWPSALAKASLILVLRRCGQCVRVVLKEVQMNESHCCSTSQPDCFWWMGTCTDVYRYRWPGPWWPKCRVELTLGTYSSRHSFHLLDRLARLLWQVHLKLACPCSHWLKHK